MRNPHVQIEERRIGHCRDDGLLEFEEGVIDGCLIAGQLDRVERGGREVLLPGQVVREIRLSGVPDRYIQGSNFTWATLSPASAMLEAPFAAILDKVASKASLSASVGFFFAA